MKGVNPCASLATSISFRCGLSTELSHNNCSAISALFLRSVGSTTYELLATPETELLVVGFVTGVPETPIPIRLSSSPDVGSKVSGGQLKVGIASSASG